MIEASEITSGTWKLEHNGQYSIMNFSDPEAEYYKNLYKLGLFETADIKFSYTTLFPKFDKNGRFESVSFIMTYEIQFKTDK